MERFTLVTVYRPCTRCAPPQLIPAHEWHAHLAMHKRQTPAAVYRSSAGWRRARAERLALDGYRCQKCGSETDLEVHHVHGVTDSRIQLLVTLCVRCHPRPDVREFQG